MAVTYPTNHSIFSFAFLITNEGWLIMGLHAKQNRYLAVYGVIYYRSRKDENTTDLSRLFDTITQCRACPWMNESI